MRHTIFDNPFNGMPGSEALQTMVMPEAFNAKTRKKMHLENWDPDDVYDYCGPRAYNEVMEGK